MKLEKYSFVSKKGIDEWETHSKTIKFQKTFLKIC